MTHALYFIPIIGDALAGQDPEKRLKEALDRIATLGKQAGYEDGFRQFRLFMREVKRESEKRVHPLKLMDQYSLGIETGKEATLKPEASLLKNKKVIGKVPLQPLPVVKDFPSMTPGYYELRLTTGRIVWMADVSGEDLIFSEAFPEEYLDLAADTEDAIVRKSREYQALGNQVGIEVYPGFENGMIRITVSDGKRIR